MLDGGAYAIAKAMQEQSVELRYQKLREAVRRLYYSAHWFADRPVNKAQLWTDVRDAAEFLPGGSPKEITLEHGPIADAFHAVDGDTHDYTVSAKLQVELAIRGMRIVRTG